MKLNYYVIGLMSGTSLDGLDIAYVKFLREEDWSFEVLATRSVSYSKEWQMRLRDLMHKSEEEILLCDQALASFFADQIQSFCSDEKIDQIDFIASHGHTIFHQPEKGITLQIGNGEFLANALGLPVIYDFRTQDVAMGGQGAPLVPIGDQLLFSAFDFCLNIGGIANVSFQYNHKRVAYDICAANILLNHYATLEGLDYDKDATLSKEGRVNTTLLQALQAIPYHHRPFPKSLGREYVLEHFFPCIASFELSNSDILRTCVEYMAVEMASHCSAWGSNRPDVLVTGGGAHHPLLMDRLQALAQADIIVPNDALVDFKEAIIFGFLGVLRFRNEVNCLAEVTGAPMDHSSGKIAMPTRLA